MLLQRHGPFQKVEQLKDILQQDRLVTESLETLEPLEPSQPVSGVDWKDSQTKRKSATRHQRGKKPSNTLQPEEQATRSGSQLMGMVTAKVSDLQLLRHKACFHTEQTWTKSCVDM